MAGPVPGGFRCRYMNTTEFSSFKQMDPLQLVQSRGHVGLTF